MSAQKLTLCIQNQEAKIRRQYKTAKAKLAATGNGSQADVPTENCNETDEIDVGDGFFKLDEPSSQLGCKSEYADMLGTLAPFWDVCVDIFSKKDGLSGTSFIDTDRADTLDDDVLDEDHGNGGSVKTSRKRARRPGHGCASDIDDDDGKKPKSLGQLFEASMVVMSGAIDRVADSISSQRDTPASEPGVFEHISNMLARQTEIIKENTNAQTDVISKLANQQSQAHNAMMEALQGLASI